MREEEVLFLCSSDEIFRRQVPFPMLAEPEEEVWPWWACPPGGARLNLRWLPDLRSYCGPSRRVFSLCESLYKPAFGSTVEKQHK